MIPDEFVLTSPCWLSRGFHKGFRGFQMVFIRVSEVLRSPRMGFPLNLCRFPMNSVIPDGFAVIFTESGWISKDFEDFGRISNDSG